MDYQAHYNRLIARAQSRKIEGYFERHHVIPKCLGGSEEAGNKVDLTPEEHLVAHELLIKIHPQNRLLVYAVFMMSLEAKNNKRYGWLHRAHSKAVGERMRGSAHPQYGKHQTEEWKKKVSLSLMGNSRRKGIKHTPEIKQQISATLKAKNSHINLGRKHTAETKAKHAAAMTGRVLSGETLDKMSASRKLWWARKKGEEQCRQVA